MGSPKMWKCPRCGHIQEAKDRRRALSRTDNRTYVCSPCGTTEAFEQFAGELVPKVDWKGMS